MSGEVEKLAAIKTLGGSASSPRILTGRRWRSAVINNYMTFF
jgi:hypothetical protein